MRNFLSIALVLSIEGMLIMSQNFKKSQSLLLTIPVVYNE